MPRAIFIFFKLTMSSKKFSRRQFELLLTTGDLTFHANCLIRMDLLPCFYMPRIRIAHSISIYLEELKIYDTNLNICRIEHSGKLHEQKV